MNQALRPIHHGCYGAAASSQRAPAAPFPLDPVPSSSGSTHPGEPILRGAHAAKVSSESTRRRWHPRDDDALSSKAGNPPPDGPSRQTMRARGSEHDTRPKLNHSPRRGRSNEIALSTAKRAWQRVQHLSPRARPRSRAEPGGIPPPRQRPGGDRRTFGPNPGAQMERGAGSSPGAQTRSSGIRQLCRRRKYGPTNCSDEAMPASPAGPEPGGLDRAQSQPIARGRGRIRSAPICRGSFPQGVPPARQVSPGAGPSRGGNRTARRSRCRSRTRWH